MGFRLMGWGLGIRWVVYSRLLGIMGLLKLFVFNGQFDLAILGCQQVVSGNGVLKL
jgi:hypothetical protein